MVHGEKTQHFISGKKIMNYGKSFAYKFMYSIN